MNPFNNEASYYDIFHKDKDYKGEAQKIRDDFPDVKTILEVGCGTGLLSYQLEKLGFEVTGIDTSSAMLENYRGKNATRISIQEFVLNPLKKKFDLFLAHYDVLNYIAPADFFHIMTKRWTLARYSSIETWSDKPVIPFTYKKADGCHRVRLGFRIFRRAYLWYIFWGKGLVISHHKLYLH